MKITSHNPRVLVLLAAFNGRPWIREQLDSILRQRGVEPHIFVSDDASSDGTPDEVERYIADGAAVTLTRREVGAGSAAQNFLSMIRAHPADGFDFVALADQDDVWLEDKLRRACDALAASGASGYSSAVIAVWTDGSRRVIGRSEKPNSTDFLLEGAGQGCTFVLRADFYRRVRRFFIANPALTQPLHYHDWAIYALARVWGLKWIIDPAPTLEYRQHHRNDTGARSSLPGVVRRFALIRDGWYRRQLIAIAELCRAAAPSHPIVAEWLAVLSAPPGFRRRWSLAHFCVRGGRRRPEERIITVFAALAGWI